MKRSSPPSEDAQFGPSEAIAQAGDQGRVNQSVEYESSFLLEQLEEARTDKEMTKADVAKSIAKNPAAIRRLLTSESFNPELHTLIQLADSVGLRVELVRRRRPYRRRDEGE